jgi:hypothetical protein
MSAILDFHDYCEIETDGATDVTIVRHNLAHHLPLPLDRWAVARCRGRTLTVSGRRLFTFR